jgi:glycosyltransferase involved in cell wall biosynthesis
MLKILILSHRFYPEVGGIETNSEILASAFHRFGTEVHVLTWTKHNNKNQFPFAVIRDPDLVQLFREHQWADVVFENNPCLRLSWPNTFIRKPLVIAVNTWVNRTKGNKGVQDKLKSLWFKRAKSVIAVSEAVRRKEWPGAVVIENPYNDRLFKITGEAERKIPFVFLGRLVSDKGADQAIRAISMLINEKLLDKNHLQLTIIGDGPERKKLMFLRKELSLYGAIHFTGILKGKELVECLNKHEFILVPSSWEEPYGNVVLEGMACGCIPVTSNGGGMPEAVGNAGFIFKRNNLGDMVDTLKSVLSGADKVEHVLRQVPEHLKKHSLEVVAERYFTIIKGAASCKAGPKMRVPENKKEAHEQVKK